ncbi:MAG: Flp pilus assembly complex ATPase component TadA [Treponema sp.]|nr:Flp pilus assembly complex ATPase component TadA [Treponema sp.]
MQNYEFKLTPAYCLYNGVAVKEQKGSFIKFITEDIKNESLKESLGKAFRNHIEHVQKRNECIEEYKKPLKVEFISGSHEEVRNHISKLYREEYSVKTRNEDKQEKKKSEAAAILLLDSLMDEAVFRKATDIHIEKNHIRFRVNGVLEEYAQIQRERLVELILRIKLLAGMNVLERRKSQDGRFVYKKDSPVFVRVSSMGIVGDTAEDSDESVVLRILDTKRLPLGLQNLGFSEKQLTAMETLLTAKNGLILVCGPTGSGKSTTAASMLLEIIRNCSNGKKVISIEDPPEYVIPGVTQIKIDKYSSCTYETALESIFRQDPDVMMIGEIRNESGAQAALRASMTGHLVIATLHTDSAASSVLRLENLGCSSKVLSSVLRGIILQELDHNEEEINLVAEVLVAKPSLKVVLQRNSSLEEIEQSFIHFSNVRYVLAKINHNREKKIYISQNNAVIREAANDK